MQVPHDGPGLADDTARQGRLDLPEAPATPLAKRRLWIVASDRPLEISSRHHHLFVDSEHGALLFSPSDLFLLRTKEGRFVLFGPEAANGGRAAADIRGADLAQRIAQASNQPRSRGPIREILMLSSKPQRGHARGGAPSRRRQSARTQLEIALFRLAMMPIGSGEPDAISALGDTVTRGAHPIIPSLFQREYADASASLFNRTGDPSFADEALEFYIKAARQFEAIGMRHQSRASLTNAKSVSAEVNEPSFPGFECVPKNGRAIGFSAERLCGFAISLDAIAPSLDNHAAEAQLYNALGEVELSDQSLLRALSGLASPSRRLVATSQLHGDALTVTAGVFDEMRALLRLNLDQPDHDDVAAIRVSCNSVLFDGPPWIIRPDGRAVFTARANPRRLHRLTVRATMLRGNSVYLNFNVHAGQSELRQFS